jgi:hypothetical protein
MLTFKALKDRSKTEQIMLQIISKLFGGSKSEKDVKKKFSTLVVVINGHFETYKSL